MLLCIFLGNSYECFADFITSVDHLLFLNLHNLNDKNLFPYHFDAYFHFNIIAPPDYAHIYISSPIYFMIIRRFEVSHVHASSSFHTSKSTQLYLGKAVCIICCAINFLYCNGMLLYIAYGFPKRI